MQAADRRQLIGLLTSDPQLVLDEGAQVMAVQSDAAALREWLELGEWENTPVPTQLSGLQLWTRSN